MKHGVWLLAAALALAPPIAARQPVPLAPLASDAALRSALAGQWAWQFADDRTRSVIYIETRRATDGTWSEAAIERTRDGERSVYVRSGRWFVTEGVLKTRTTRVDGHSVGINSRLAFQTYPLVAIDERHVIYRVPKENGHPGQWPRVIESPTELRGRVPTVVEMRVDR